MKWAGWQCFHFTLSGVSPMWFVCQLAQFVLYVVFQMLLWTSPWNTAVLKVVIIFIIHQKVGKYKKRYSRTRSCICKLGFRKHDSTLHALLMTLYLQMLWHQGYLYVFHDFLPTCVLGWISVNKQQICTGTEPPENLTFPVRAGSKSGKPGQYWAWKLFQWLAENIALCDCLL